MDAMQGLCQITWLITCNCKMNIPVHVNASFNLFDGLLFSFALSIYFVLKVVMPCQSYTSVHLLVLTADNINSISILSQ